MNVRRATASFLVIAALAYYPRDIHAQGSLAPPGAPAPTMRTLTEIEPRTPVSAAPFVIPGSGSYYVTTNLSVSSGDAITIAADGVTLDLNGFTISSTAPAAEGYAIKLESGVRDITIVNGYIRGRGTNNNSGVYSGGGFSYGIAFAGSSPRNVIVQEISVSGCANHGIYLGLVVPSSVDSCRVNDVGGFGIVAQLISQSSAFSGMTAIYGHQVSDCSGSSSLLYGISGIGVMNSFGWSDTATAIYGILVENCFGWNMGGAEGINASVAARNSRGISNSGIGIIAGSAANCYGTGYGGAYGIVGGSIQNCQGIGGLWGIYADRVMGSYGSGSSVGLRAFVASSSSGRSTSGTSLDVTHSANTFIAPE